MALLVVTGRLYSTLLGSATLTRAGLLALPASGIFATDQGNTPRALFGWLVDTIEAQSPPHEHASRAGISVFR